MTIESVSVVGLGKVGTPMVVSFASKGYEVIGVDKAETLVDDINNGVSRLKEAHVQDFLDRHKDRIRATLDFSDAVASSNITFVIVPTPSEPDGRFDLRYLNDAATEIGACLREKSEYHTVVVTSTVLPGNTYDVIRATLEAKSGKRCGEDFGLCYNPLFIALGDVVNNILNPDFILMGEYDQRSGDTLEVFYAKVVPEEKSRERMSLHNAELTKISVNTFATTKLSFANMLAELCERLPGGDVNKVTHALGCDRRIGHRFLHGGPAYGGPCFPRDNAAFSAMAQDLGVEPNISIATDAINQRQAGRLVELIRSLLPFEGAVGILGLAYKPNTDVIEESASIKLAQQLGEAEIPVIAYDPLAVGSTRDVLGDAISYASSTREVLESAQLTIIMTGSDEFRSITPADFGTHERPALPILLDCWDLYTPSALGDQVQYLRVGEQVNKPSSARTRSL